MQCVKDLVKLIFRMFFCWRSISLLSAGLLPVSFTSIENDEQDMSFVNRSDLDGLSQ
jgi:hypothetical protein